MLLIKGKIEMKNILKLLGIMAIAFIMTACSHPGDNFWSFDATDHGTVSEKIKQV